MTDTYSSIIARVEHGIGHITMNRPKQLNALNDALMDELGAALTAYDADEGIGCIVITGEDRSGGEVSIRLWVEVKRPVIHVDLDSDRKMAMTASYESWRFKDVVLAPEEKPPHEGRRSSIFDTSRHGMEGLPESRFHAS